MFNYGKSLIHGYGLICDRSIHSLIDYIYLCATMRSNYVSTLNDRLPTELDTINKLLTIIIILITY